ncbi:conserved protein of unknown function [Tenacibaculum sp. 190130A14a]|uniref:Lipoprotein n=1 Tax=Tenacibaculum polynesiense TaxID=3137857 RepID=A0ABP1F3M2_9FLAO
MKKLILLLLLGGLISCSKNNELKEIQILFGPSFLNPTKFTIDIKEKTILQYNYQINSEDTFTVLYEKEFPIGSVVFDKFLRDLKESKLDSTITHRKDILDGIGYRISKIYNRGDTISLTSNLTRRNEESGLEYKMLDAFFDLAYQSINDYDGVSGLENIQDYFYYGLPIKKMDKEPLEYRVWGSISGCREDNEEFIDFLNNLPADKPVIFDLRNGSIAYCLNDVLEEFSQKRELYFYGDQNAMESKSIMEEIKLAEKNGEELSELRKQAYEIHKEMYEYWKNNTKINSSLTKEEVLNKIDK